MASATWFPRSPTTRRSRNISPTRSPRRCPPAAPLIPSALIRPLAEAYTRSDNFKPDFVEAMNQQHDWLFEEAKPEDEGQVMSLNLTPMVNRVINDRILERCSRSRGRSRSR